MPEKVNTSAPNATGAADDIPDLRAVIDSEKAAAAGTRFVDEHTASGEPMHLGSLTDEELAVCLGSLAAAEPAGRWMASLGEFPRRVAMIAAFRSLTSREELVVVQRNDGPEFSVSDRLMGVLRLRNSPVRLTAQAMTPRGSTWYVLRQCDGAWLREVVSEQGHHTFDLVQLDDNEELFFRVVLQLQEQQIASDVVLTQPTGPPEGETVAFLAKQQHVTQVALVHPDQDEPESFIVSHDRSGTLTMGDVTAAGVTYAGALPAEVTARWTAWRKRW